MCSSPRRVFIHHLLYCIMVLWVVMLHTGDSYPVTVTNNSTMIIYTTDDTRISSLPNRTNARLSKRYQPTPFPLQSTTTNRYGPTLYKGKTWQQAGDAGLIYGYQEFINKHRSRTFHEPTICENHYDYRDNNSTTAAGYQFLVCPMEGQSTYHTHCCGEKHRQKCCCFWENEHFLAGLINGIAFLAAIGIFMAYCCRGKPLVVNRNSEVFIKYNAMFSGGRGMPGYTSPIKPMKQKRRTKTTYVITTDKTGQRHTYRQKEVPKDDNRKR